MPLPGTAGTAVFLSIAYATAARSGRPTRRRVPPPPSAPPRPASRAGRAAAPGLGGGQTALNNTAFLARLNPVLAQPFRQGFTSALDIAFLTAVLVIAAALVLAMLIRELPLRTTVATPSATPAEPARQ